MKNERANNAKTKLLYETDGLLMEFEATVTGSGDDGGCYVILDRTAFFPGGGGQSADTGYLMTGDGTKRTVSDVRIVDDEVCHFIDGPVPEGQKVTGVVDRKQRIGKMQDHGAEHLISGLIHERFGYDNVGFHMSEDETVLDFNGPLTEEQIRQTEMRANEIIFENVPITVSFPTPEEVEKTDYRSKLDLNENVRLVTIEGYDTCACCAPHLPSTGMFGLVRIVDFMPHRGGTRMSLIAGMNAYEDYTKLCDQNARIMKILSAPRYGTAAAVNDFSEKTAKLREENTELRKKMTALAVKQYTGELKSADEKSEPVKVLFVEDLDMTGLRNLVNECTKVYSGTVCAFLPGQEGYRYIFSVCERMAESAGIRELAADLNSTVGGKGGGSPVMVTGTTDADRGRIEAFFAKKARF